MVFVRVAAFLESDGEGLCVDVVIDCLEAGGFDFCHT